MSAEQTNITAFDIFNRQRVEGEYNVIESVRETMASHGVSSGSLHVFDTNDRISRMKESNSDAQMFALGIFLNTQLSLVSQINPKRSTVPEREILGTQMRPSEFLTCFKEKILPTLLEFELPKRI